MVRAYPESKALVLPARQDVLRIVPQARAFTAQGHPFMALPHEPEMVRLLYNLGVKAPEPIRFYYDWAGNTPFKSQIDTAALMSTHRRCYVLNEMGTGKTRATLFAFDYLRSIGRVKRMLVVAPLSTLVTVWQNEVFSYLHHLDTVVLHGSRAKRLKLLASKADIYIINHDGVETIASQLLAENFDVITVDELTAYINRSNDRWKALSPIVQPAPWVWGLTGEPRPNGPTDVYGQVKLVTPSNVGFSFKEFKQDTMLQVTNFKWIERQDANDHVFKAMQPSIRVTRDQAFDLPPTTYTTRQVEMDTAAVKPYKDMLKQFATQIQNKEITAANEGVKLSKLLQISAGFAYDGDSEGQYVGCKHRIKEILTVIENCSRKVIVFTPFTYMAKLLAGVIGKRWPTALVYGEVPKRERDQIFADFQSQEFPRIIVAHPKTMSHGLNLTRADTIIWASPTVSLETYHQANARIPRAGQSAKTHIVHLIATKAEQQVYDRLRHKASMQGILLDMFRDQQ
jgi:SNF2 family DNA or RNA helicase